MPPVKRTRSTRASTRAAKTARAPSRPTAPQEQTANSAPTTSENAGMVNVNLEALTASLSAAVQQAVRSALTTASTSGGSPQRKDIVAQVPDVPENLVSQVVETEVSDLTNAGQIPLNTEGTGPRPTTEFRSVAISLAARVNSKTKAKIWAQQYIDLGSLLSIAPSNNSYSLSLKSTNRNSSATPKLCLEPNDKPRRIFNINQWLTAFNIFVSVYTERFNQAAPKLMKYCETVRDISAKGGDWRYYDEQFRFLRESDPNLFPWDHIHWELWFQTMISARNISQKAVANSDRDKPPNRVPQQFPKGTCWAFHGGKTCSGCKFEHVCFKCGSRHPASQCPTQYRGKSKTSPAGEQADRPKPQTSNASKSG